MIQFIEHIKILMVVIFMVTSSWLVYYMVKLNRKAKHKHLKHLKDYTILFNSLFLFLFFNLYFEINFSLNEFEAYLNPFYDIAKYCITVISFFLIIKLLLFKMSMKSLKIESIIIKIGKIGFIIITLLYIIKLSSILFKFQADLLVIILNNLFNNLIILEIPVLIFIFFKKDSIKINDKANKVFSLLYLSRYIIALVFLVILKNNKTSTAFVLLIEAVIMLYVLLIPIIWLKYYLFQLKKDSLDILETDSSIDFIIRKYNLTKRETELISHVIEGKSNSKIASELFISSHTVKNHIYNIFKKLGISSRYELLSILNHTNNTAE